MPSTRFMKLNRRRKEWNSFTLIEMLTVLAIILILAALMLNAGIGIWQRSLRSRAASEIQGLGSALDAYKTDNGIYPNTNVNTGIGMPNGLTTNTAAAPYFSTTLDGKSTAYIQNSQILYLNLSGQTNFADTTLNTNNKAYFFFKRSQVADGTGGSYVKDPWNYAYGYSTGTMDGGATTNYPFNGAGFYDLWSTGGTSLTGKTLQTQTNVNAWISNWQH